MIISTNVPRLYWWHLHSLPLNSGYENIDCNLFFFKIKESKITRRQIFTLTKEQSWLDVRKYAFSQRTINGCIELSTDCVRDVNMFNHRMDTHIVKAGYKSRLHF